MPRARNIKPSFFTNEDLVELPLGTRLLFIGLWTLCDREGRFKDKPKTIKLNLFPADNINIDKALDQLQEKKFILRYVVDGERYILVYNFTKHQTPHVKESASTIPAPVEHGASTGQILLNDERGKMNDERGIQGKAAKNGKPFKSKSDDPLVQKTETVLGYALDLPSQMVLTETIPARLVADWIRYLKTRMVGNFEKPEAFLKSKFNYWLGDFVKENKREIEKLKDDLPDYRDVIESQKVTIGARPPK